MKSKLLFFTLLMLIYTAIAVKAQNPLYPRPNSRDNIPFGKRLPPPALHTPPNGISQRPFDKRGNAPYITFDTATRKYRMNFLGRMSKEYPLSLPLHGNKNQAQSGHRPNNHTSNFHLTKDINTLKESNPNNYTQNNYPSSFAVLNNVSYFAADDGVHGSELWRSDGTVAGTYLVKDINPGEASSYATEISVANGKLFFSAITSDAGQEPWVSDGTEAGTHLLMDITSGIDNSYPVQFVNVNNTVFFVATGIHSYYTELWKTDGTTSGTRLVKDIGATQYADFIADLTAANGQLFFTVYTEYLGSFGRKLWRSDGTDAGTYVVKDINPNDGNGPLQFTEYNHKLYFSADDGTGRKLWVSDGTADGTMPVPGNNDVLIQADNIYYFYNNFPFRIVNNNLYVAGYTPTTSSGLYKYNAANADGVVLVKDLSAGSTAGKIVEMAVANNALFFSVTSSAGTYLANDLWVSKGEASNTELLLNTPRQSIYTLYAGYGILYFSNYDPAHGNELWKSNGTVTGTEIVKDIYAGSFSSYPYDFTALNGKLLFGARGAEKGTELWMTDGSDAGTNLLKDINTTTTSGSDADRWANGIAALGDAVIFSAYEPKTGTESYKSDGTSTGTSLISDIVPGEEAGFPNNFLSKNNAVYFIAYAATGYAIYKTDGTTGLQKITDISSTYYIVSYDVADNGLVFYEIYNFSSGIIELWRSDGTKEGTYLLNPNLYYSSIVIAANAVFFVAGNDINGYELWKSDGTVAGTKLVKDINPGYDGSYPYSLFLYNKEVYFGAYNGTGYYYSFWKSDGSEQGTIKLKDITPNSYDKSYSITFCVSGNTLYFSAIDNNATPYQGSQLWKTDGTAEGTELVKVINPFYDFLANNLTDVNGILFFTADDGVHGNELWSSKGTADHTQMVEDITPGVNGSYLSNLCNAGDKLFFLKDPYTNDVALWLSGRVHASDVDHDDTRQVEDAVLNGLSSINNLTGAGNKLFFSAYTYKYGSELYVGDVGPGTFAPVTVAATDLSAIKINSAAFDAILYPNPTRNASALQIKGNAKNVGITITDMAGRVIWEINENNKSQINLPVEKLAAGEYIITVKSGADKKTLKLVKE